MEGAALASLFSYMIYYLIVLSVLWWKIKVSPFSMKELYVLLIVIALFIMNYIITRFVSDYIISIFNIEILGKIIEAVIRTLILFTIGIIVIYKINISKQVNDIIDKFLWKFVRKA